MVVGAMSLTRSAVGAARVSHGGRVAPLARFRLRASPRAARYPKGNKVFAVLSNEPAPAADPTIKPKLQSASPSVMQRVSKFVGDLTDGFEGLSDKNSETAAMNIVFVASEVAPWSKTGGLGDVMGSLPAALAARGHRVMVIAPRYGAYEEAEDTGVKQSIHLWGATHEVGYFHTYKDGVDYTFVDHPGSFMRAGTPYGDAHGEFGDNQFRFSLFSYAAMEAPLVLPLGGFTYGDECVFVANDWHTALVPILLAAKYRPYGVYLGARSLLCIHNLFHQGCFPPTSFNELGLDSQWYDAMGYQFMERAHMSCYSYGHAVNYMKGGLMCADRIITVSPGYAREITTPEGGWRMEGILSDRQFVVNGIVNGMRFDEWSPEADEYIHTNYSMDTLEEGKAACKAALQRSMGLPQRPDVPVIGFVGRLDQQKGADLILGCMDWLAEQDVQVVMLGSGRTDLEDGFKWAESQYRDKVRAYVGFNVPVSHQVTAGADILLMPSRFEPCGLNQLYAMKYGTPVVAHATGGLRDTVIDVNACKAVDSDEGTGWTFEHADCGGLMHALGCALWTYQNDKEGFRRVQQQGMQRDSSWDTAAANYEEIFQWACIDPPYCG